MNNYLMCGRLLKGMLCQLSVSYTDPITDVGIFLDYKLHFLNQVNYIFIIVLSYWVWSRYLSRVRHVLSSLARES